MDDPTAPPAGLPLPAEDGAAAHLTGLVVPRIALLTTEGTTMVLGDVGPNPRRVVYAYPMTGCPGEPPLEDRDLIPGSRGCTPRRARSATATRTWLVRRGRATRCSDARTVCDHEGSPVPPVVDNAQG
jgi:hypothetical protein